MQSRFKGKGAHVQPHNEKCKLMEKVCIVMMEVVPGNHNATYQNPAWKTCNNHFELILKQRRDMDRRKRNQSSISGKISELDMLLDDLILECDTVEEQRRKEREVKTVKYRHMEEAGIEVHNDAMTRISKRSSSSNNEDDESNGKKMKKRRIATVDAEDREMEMLVQRIADQRETEGEKLDLEKKRLELGEKHRKEEIDRANRAMDLDEKRLAIEQQRMAMEKQNLLGDMVERRAAIEEPKSTVRVMSALVKKLS